MSSQSRHAHIAQARQIAIYLIKKHTKLSLEEIGDMFNRDHATVLYSIQVIENNMFMSSDFALEICELMDKVGVRK
jgi:chromosomal replication initiator protein